MKFVSRLFLGAGLVLSPLPRVAIAADAAGPAATGVASDLAMLRASAERGDALAQYNLGIAFAEGRQTPVDPVEALVWLTLASERGTTAKELDTLLVSLSAEQIAAAGRRLESIRASHPNLRSTPIVGAVKAPPAVNTPSPILGAPAAAASKATDARPRTSVAPEKSLPSAGDERSAAKTTPALANSKTQSAKSRPPAFAPSDSELNSLRSQVSILERDLRNARAALKRVAAERTAAETTLVAENQKLTDAMQELKSHLDQLEAGKATLPSRPVETGISEEEFARATAAQAEAERKLSVALRTYTLMTRERDELRAQVSAARELESRLRQLEAEKASLQDGDSYVSKGEYVRVVAAQADAENKLSTALRAFALLKKERDELRAQIAERSKKVFTSDRDEPASPR